MSAVDAVRRIRRGDFEAVPELCEALRPDSLDDLIERVYPSRQVDPDRFDAVADAYAEWRDREAALRARDDQERAAGG